MRPCLHDTHSLTGPAQSQLLCDHSHLQLCSLHGAHGRCTNQNNLTSAWIWTHNRNTWSMGVREIPIAGSLRALYRSLRASGVRVRRRSSPPIICTNNKQRTLKSPSHGKFGPTRLWCYFTLIHAGMVMLRLQRTCWLSSYLVDLRWKDSSAAGSLLLSLTLNAKQTHVSLERWLSEKKKQRRKADTLTVTGRRLSLKAWKLKQRGCWVAFLTGMRFPEHSRWSGMPSITWKVRHSHQQCGDERPSPETRRQNGVLTFDPWRLCADLYVSAASHLCEVLVLLQGFVHLIISHAVAAQAAFARLIHLREDHKFGHVGHRRQLSVQQVGKGDGLRRPRTVCQPESTRQWHAVTQCCHGPPLLRVAWRAC